MRLIRVKLVCSRRTEGFTGEEEQFTRLEPFLWFSCSLPGPPCAERAPRRYRAGVISTDLRTRQKGTGATESRASIVARTTLAGQR